MTDSEAIQLDLVELSSPASGLRADRSRCPPRRDCRPVGQRCYRVAARRRTSRRPTTSSRRRKDTRLSPRDLREQRLGDGRLRADVQFGLRTPRRTRPYQSLRGEQVFPWRSGRRLFAQAEGLSSIVINPRYDDGADEQIVSPIFPTCAELSTLHRRRDLPAGLVRCIEASTIGFAIVHGVSETASSASTSPSTRDLIGAIRPAG